MVQTTETGFSFLEARKSLKLRRTSFHDAETFSGDIGSKILLPTPSLDVSCQRLKYDSTQAQLGVPVSLLNYFQERGKQKLCPMSSLTDFQAAWPIGVSYPQQLLLLYITLRRGLLSPVSFRNSVPCKSLLLPRSLRRLSHILILPSWLLFFPLHTLPCFSLSKSHAGSKIYPMTSFGCHNL